MASFIRDSKFRHCHVAVARKEEFYDTLKVANVAVDGNLVTANSSFFAYVDSSAGGSAVAVLPLTSTGKNHIPILAPSYQQPLIRAHSQNVQDLAFSGFSSQKNKIFTCSTDSTLKLWDIPTDGFLVDTMSPISVFASSTSTAFRAIACHPCAENILAVRGAREVFVVDTTTSCPVQLMHIPTDSFATTDLQSFTWSYDGRLLLTTGKDRILRKFDVRSSPSLSLSQTQIHEGNRNSRVTWLGNSPYLLTCGHTVIQDREIAIWDSRNLSKPVKRERIDSSTGTLLPFFDPDTGLLILAGKGDTSVRLYEFEAASGTLYPISNTPVGDLIKGACLLPKRANDLMSCEVLRMLKLTDNAVQPVSFTVPRKEKLKFHDDLFPPTVWEVKPAATAADWLAGSDLLLAVETIAAPLAATATSVRTNTTACVIDPEVSSIPSLSPSSARPLSFGNQLKYKHVFGTEHTKAETFYNIKPNTSAIDSPLIACSDTFWAVPCLGGGGPVYVSKLTAFGKVEPSCPMVNGHKAAVLDIAFSPFHSNIMATASDDSTVKIWSLDQDRGVNRDHTDADAAANLTSHRHSVRTCNFHPTVSGLLFTTSLDLTIRLYDINVGKEISSLESRLVEGGQVANLTFNYDGSMCAVATKDRKVKLLDPRSNSVCLDSSDTGLSLGRNLRVEWCSTRSALSALCVVSSGTSGMRHISLYDPRRMSTAICTSSIDNAAGQLFAMYDEDLGLILLAGKGDTIIRGYETTFLNEDEVTCVKSNEFQSSKSPISGICLLPKRLMDVRNVEISRLLKLTTDSVLPISFHLPRADILKQYFQDDVFVPTRGKTPAASVADWTADCSLDLTPVLDSLQPEDMSPISAKPEGPVRVSRVVVFKDDIKKAEDEKKEKEDTFTRLQDLAIQRSMYHPNASGGGHGFKCDAMPVHMTATAEGTDQTPDVADDEWD